MRMHRVRPSATSSDATFVLEGWAGGNEVMKQHFVSHREAGARWTLDGVQLPGEAGPQKVSELATKLMLAGSHHGHARCVGTALGPADSQLAGFLEQAGLVKQVSDSRWALSEARVAHMSACAVLRDPQPVFAVRGPPLTELTTFELCVKLREADWEWRLWLPKGARPKKALPIPDGYLPGADRVWFSTAAQASRSYLLALLTAEDLNSWRYVCYWMVVRSLFFVRITQALPGCVVVFSIHDGSPHSSIC